MGYHNTAKRPLQAFFYDFPKIFDFFSDLEKFSLFHESVYPFLENSYIRRGQKFSYRRWGAKGSGLQDLVEEGVSALDARGKNGMTLFISRRK